MNIELTKQALKKAHFLQKAGSTTQAKKICEDILNDDNTNFDTHNLLGLCLYNLKNFEDSIKSFKNAIELNPSDLSFYINLANSYNALKEDEKAISIFKKIIDIDQNSDIAHNGIALIYQQKRDFKNALIYFKKTIKIDNKSYLYHYNIANTYSSLCKYELCIFHLQKVIRICPDFNEALYSMAQCYKKMENDGKMLEYLQRTLEKLPEHPGANHLLASHNGDTTSKYCSSYAKNLFDKYADHFEEHLLTTLEYQVPSIIKEKLKSLNPQKKSKALDLGCGTGLVGKNIIEIFPNITGVDISANMIEETKKKNIYSELYVNNIDDFFLKNTQKFDLIIAADVFIYIGDLQIIFSYIKKYLSNGGYFIFTIELFTKMEKLNFQVGKNRRFSHNIEYIEQLSKDIGFEIVDKEEIILRQENKTGQKGAVFTLKITN